MTVAVLVPYRPDGGRRDDLMEWTTARLRRLHPDFEVVIGTHEADEGPFNRSAAINRAAAETDADVLVVADSDSFVGPDQLVKATEMVGDGGSEFVLAYDEFHYLNRAMSDEVMAGFVGSWLPGVEWSMTGTCSSMVVVTRRLFDDVGGFCESFEGWGFEDVAFSLAAQTFGGGLRRVPGGVWHLWHPPSTENNDKAPEWVRNRALLNDRFAPASYKPAEMRALLDELAA